MISTTSSRLSWPVSIAQLGGLIAQQAHEALKHAMEASQRGAHLIEQLLAFARQKPFSIELCDINDILRDFEPLIGHALGSGVKLVVKLADSPMFANVDRSQFETALINLTVNARDARQKAGR
jgi:signal transduction histidine kinase